MAQPATVPILAELLTEALSWACCGSASWTAWVEGRNEEEFHLAAFRDLAMVGPGSTAVDPKATFKIGV